MKSIWKFIVAQQGLFYKSLLILSSSALTLYLFPLGGQFKYEFQKGRVWQYPDFYSPFDFSILKTELELKKDEEKVLKNLKPYLRADIDIKNQIFEKYSKSFDSLLSSDLEIENFDSLKDFGFELLKEIYSYGVLPPNYKHNGNESVFLIQEQIEISTEISQLFSSETLFEFINNKLKETQYIKYEDFFKDLFFDLIIPNITLDQDFFITAEKEALQNISRSKGFIASGDFIIAEGELLDDETYEILNSLRKEFTLQQDRRNSFFIVFGYAILIILIYAILLFFIYNYRYDIYEDNRKLTFIFFNVLIVIVAFTLTINYNTNYVFAVPICILPLIIKAFFDSRLGLYTHLLTVLLVGFLVPNSFEFIFIQITAGIMTVLSQTKLYKRANLFLTVGQTFIIYMIGYISFTTIQEGSILEINFAPITMFLLNGLLMLFVQETCEF